MKTLPPLNTPFTLTLDFDKVDPLEMVKNDGYSSWKDWKFNGPKIMGKQTKEFMLVQIGTCCDLDEVREKLAVYGEIPDGRWRQALKVAYQVNEYVGIIDPSWVDPNGYANFPCVHSSGGSHFRTKHLKIFKWAGFEHGEGWRWLVFASKSLGPLGTSEPSDTLESRVAKLEAFEEEVIRLIERS